METKKILFQDFFKTTTIDSIADSWDIDFEVWEAPENSSWWIIVNPESSSLRERMFYHNVSWSRIYVKWVNRYSPKSHLAWATVQINDSALIFNYLSENASTAFYIQKVSALDIIVWGWVIMLQNIPTEVVDTNITLSNNSTNYIYYDINDETIKKTTSLSTANWNWIIVAEIIVASSIITSIKYRKYAFNYITTTKWDTWEPWVNWLSAYEIAVNEWFFWTEKEWLASLVWPQWDINNTWETQNVNDLITLPDWATVTYSDSEKWVKITFLDWTYTLYTATWNTHPFTLASWIYQYSSDDELLSSNLVDWTYNIWTHSITYIDWNTVNWATWETQITEWNIAYINKKNIFSEQNTFGKTTIFKSNVAFPNYIIDKWWNAWVITFNWNNWTKQRTKNLWTWSCSLVFTNILWWSNYWLAINVPTWWITISWYSITNSWTITWLYSIWDNLPTSLTAWTHLFYMDTFVAEDDITAALHISYLWESRSNWSF